MNFKIHRGTKEIGGSCVEVWTASTRILLDFGMPLVNHDGSEFNFNEYKKLTPKELVEKGVLPDIKGLYDNSEKSIDGVIISHPHQDHFGLINFIDKIIQCYLGEASHELIKIGNIFTRQKIQIEHANYFEKHKTFQIGDISITPYWVDHSAFDAYSFLVEANGKSIFYSGDFRSHGRKWKVFKWFTHNAPQNVDYLLLEGTSIGRDNKRFKTEKAIENEFVDVFKQPDKINLIYTSGQNIDRIVSIFRACKRTNKTLVVDVYVASILKALKGFAEIPYPSKKFSNLRVLIQSFADDKIKKNGGDIDIHQFGHYKIKTDEINQQPDKYVMIVRPTLKAYLEKITNMNGGNFIYSLWDGYLTKDKTKEFVDYLTNRNFTMYKIHTSGHADTVALKEMVEAIKPKNIVPIHTFSRDEYPEIFTAPIVRLNDGETITIN